MTAYTFVDNAFKKFIREHEKEIIDDIKKQIEIMRVSNPRDSVRDVRSKIFEAVKDNCNRELSLLSLEADGTENIISDADLIEGICADKEAMESFIRNETLPEQRRDFFEAEASSITSDDPDLFREDIEESVNDLLDEWLPDDYTLVYHFSNEVTVTVSVVFADGKWTYTAERDDGNRSEMGEIALNPDVTPDVDDFFETAQSMATPPGSRIPPRLKSWDVSDDWS